LGQQEYFYGTGRRKCSVARVRLAPGKGAIVIDGAPLEERFPRAEHQRAILQPLIVTQTKDKFSGIVKVVGGGSSGQAGAIRHGVARALLQADVAFKPLLRQYGLLTRDPRIKERKKYGLKRARKAPQYTKR